MTTGHIEVIQSESGGKQLVLRGDVSVRPKIEFVNGVPTIVGHTVQDADGFTVDVAIEDSWSATYRPHLVN